MILRRLGNKSAIASEIIKYFPPIQKISKHLILCCKTYFCYFMYENIAVTLQRKKVGAH